jgi:AraC-like DNA-binding protein
MIYPDIELLTGILEDVTGRSFRGTPSFSRQLLLDPELALDFSRAHRLVEQGSDQLLAEEAMYGVLARMFGRYGSTIISPSAATGRAGISRARDYIAENYSSEIGLEELAGVAGLSRAHLIRAFRREFFITPHAFQTDMRVRHARRLLRDGASPSEAALECGFADQAHLTRHFKARTGVTPAAFRRG